LLSVVDDEQQLKLMVRPAIGCPMLSVKRALTVTIATPVTHMGLGDCGKYGRQSTKMPLPT
jgi:hypothetical protein